MRVLDIVWKDLRQVAVDWRTPVFLIVMPIIFTIFFGLAFSGGGEVDPRLPVGVVNGDDGLLGAQFVDAVAASDVIRAAEVADPATAALREAVREGDLAAAVVVPAGVTAAWLNDETSVPQVEVWTDPGTQEGQAAQTELQVILLRVYGAAETASIAVDVRAAHGAETDAALKERLAATALTAWEEPAFTVETAPAVERAEEATSDNSYAQSSPGMMIQFGITGVMSAAALLVRERTSRTLARLLTTALTRWQIIVGKLLGGFILIFGQIVILSSFGQLLYGLPYYAHPLALLVLGGAFAFTVASMGMLAGAIAKTDDSVIILIMIPMFLMSALGGAWFPLEVMPAGMRTLGRIVTPTAWAMEGFQDLIVRGQGLEAVWLPAGVVAAWGVVFLVVAVWRLRFVAR